MVGFRYSAAEKARTLGLAGFARNEEDGSLTIEAEGEERTLDTLVAWCREGPSFARVERVAVEELPPAHFTDFRITP